MTPASANGMGRMLTSPTPVTASSSTSGNALPISAGSGMQIPTPGSILPSSSTGLDGKAGGRGRAPTRSGMHHMQHRHHGSGFGLIPEAEIGSEDIEFERERVAGGTRGARGEGYETRSRERERWEAERRGDAGRGGERYTDGVMCGGRLPLPPSANAAQSMINLGTPPEEEHADVLRPKNKKINVACCFCRCKSYFFGTFYFHVH